MKVTLIGDVHGKTHIYEKILRQKYQDRPTIQLGDVGLGFKGVGLQRLPENHKFIRGNHDNPEKCRQHPNYLGEYGYLPESHIFYIGGAFSIDRASRVEGQSWWADEELSWLELQKVIDLYQNVRPKFVISHECPSSASMIMLSSLLGGYYQAKTACVESRTSQAMEAMFEIHHPKEWIFGHYHVDRPFEFRGTKFRCVAELSQYELETENEISI